MSGQARWKAAYGRSRASGYAELIRVAVGRDYLDTLSAVADVLEGRLPERADVVDLGAGTGNLTRKLLRRYPRARLWALDGSSAMLGKARRALSRFGSRVRFLRRDFGRADWSRGLPPMDAAVSTGAVHHLDESGKSRLFAQVFRLLRPVGAVVVGDPVWPEDRALKSRNDRLWAMSMERRLGRLGRPSPGIDGLVRWIDETRRAEGDRPTSLDKQLAWLRRAGFEQVDCHWKHFGFAVFGGVKPGAPRRAP